MSIKKVINESIFKPVQKKFEKLKVYKLPKHEIIGTKREYTAFAFIDYSSESRFEELSDSAPQLL